MISKKILLLLVMILLGIIQSQSKEVPSEGNVIILNNQNFQSVVLKSEDPWMIDFYAPWCGHCIQMSAEWQKFANNTLGSIRVAKIDASQFSKFNDAYGLKGYPHIVFLPAGKKDENNYYTHAGPRTAQAFQRWTLLKIDEHKRSFLEKLTDQQKWKSVCLGPHSDFCTIFFLPNIENSSEEEQEFYLKTINGLIKKFTRQPISWLWTQNGDHKELQKQFDLKDQYPYIVLVNPMGRRFSVMKKAFTEDEFIQWFKNAWDIEFQQFQGKLLFKNELPQNESVSNGPKDEEF